jgi:hypothetical protein
VAVLIGVIWASAAAAQTPVSTAPSPASHGGQTEFAVGASFLPPVPMGSANVDYLKSSGVPYSLANTSSRTGASVGLEVRIGFRVRQRLSFEMSGAWSHVSFQTSVANDVEASPLTASIGVSRFAAGGAIVFKIRSRGRKEIYALAGASWMREISQISTGALYDDGAIVDGGAGVKIWFRDQGKGRVKRVGLRIEGRVGLRTGGLQLDTKSPHVVSAFVGSLVIG